MAVRRIWCCLGILLIVCAATTVQAAPPDSAGVEFFELKIRPVLVEKCSGCHSGGEDAASKLTFDARSSLLTGGDFGPAIVPGKPQQSVLLQAIQRTHKELQMPPDADKRLDAATVADFRRWIELGAPWPKRLSVRPPATRVAERSTVSTSHWCFQPRRRVGPPAVDEPVWAASPIDRFVFTRLASHGLQPSGLATRRVLIRRATFDLTGLPPTPREVDAFVNDPLPDPASFGRVIDRLLASSAYGERWGRHWLDVARYADTQGDVGDFPIPAMYLYRNWVIDALNDDMPYDQFVQAQLAGDLLARRESDTQRARSLRIATGFIAVSRRFGNTLDEDQHLTIEDTIDTIGRGLMGVTLRCARCHDHKFDPLLSADYYALYGILESTRYPSMGASNQKTPRYLASATGSSDAQLLIDEYWQLITRYEYQINNHFRPWLKPTLAEYQDVVSRLAAAQQQGKPIESLESRRQQLLNSRDGRFRELMEHGLDWLKREMSRLGQHPPEEMLFSVIDGTPHDANRHLRGNPQNQGKPVPRGFPRVIGGSNRVIDLSASGREELARWLTSPEHPLTARVIVNRVWHHHFGRGIVKTVDNFGLQGALPSHPDLLDFLANQLVDGGWSLKSLHRQILSSRVYRLAGTDDAMNRERDPDNVYLWRYPRRRLDAESIRDAMLSISGQLDTSPAGPHPFGPWYQNRYSLNRPFNEVFSTRKRSVYLMTQRLFKHPLLGLFNGTDTNQTTGRRDTANTPGQALFLMNSAFVTELAEAFANRLLSSTGQGSKYAGLAIATDEVSRLGAETTGSAWIGRLRLAYRMALGRDPDVEEQRDALRFLNAYRGQARLDEQNDKAAADKLAWMGLAKILLTSNEFFFID